MISAVRGLIQLSLASYRNKNLEYMEFWFYLFVVTFEVCMYGFVPLMKYIVVLVSFLYFHCTFSYDHDMVIYRSFLRPCVPTFLRLFVDNFLAQGKKP